MDCYRKLCITIPLIADGNENTDFVVAISAEEAAVRSSYEGGSAREKDSMHDRK